MSALTVTFVEEDGTVKTLGAETGQSLMQAGKDAGVAGILADCSGACACATCHVYVDDAWADIVGGPNPIEAEMLDMVADVLKENSRLSCQIRLTPELDGLKVTVAPLG
ncbi:2Fe-2S iron-sulfur cluster-binding protein [Acidocella sp.]|uniref:2Fe-2S iron-sulfur cluster-binding protein n=1 Tax=Acidocella sp. TaxID=50710 RepID=UPI002605DCE6|nr:2Fe-2S iron-sulfur cluster-binding protein [Acidocella sp.]